MKYEVVDAHETHGGWVVTFGYTTHLPWWQRLFGKKPRRKAVVAFTKGHSDWRYFPSLHDSSFDDWQQFNDAWERHQILQGMSADANDFPNRRTP